KVPAGSEADQRFGRLASRTRYRIGCGSWVILAVAGHPVGGPLFLVGEGLEDGGLLAPAPAPPHVHLRPPKRRHHPAARTITLRPGSTGRPVCDARNTLRSG